MRHSLLASLPRRAAGVALAIALVLGLGLSVALAAPPAVHDAGVTTLALDRSARLAATASDAGSRPGTPSATATAAASTVFYVDAGATGADDGTSWTDAYVDLQDALAAATDGDEIWIAAGTYVPTTPADVNAVEVAERFVSFVVPSGVGIYGGFAGGEAERHERDWTTNRTVLSGDIDGNDLPFEPLVDSDANTATPRQTDHIVGSNSYTLVWMDHVSDQTVLDGLTITGGAADIDNWVSDMSNNAGGLYNDATGGGVSSPTFRNLVFEGNRAARDGGGFYSFANDGGTADVTLVNVVVRSNASTGTFSAHGGAMVNNGRNGSTATLTLVNSTVYDNHAYWGTGGIYNYQYNGGTGVVTLRNSVVWGNVNGQTSSYFAAFDIDDSIVEGGCDAVGGATCGDGNVDPTGLTTADLFADAASSDLTPLAAGPLVDAGDTSILPADAADLDGDGDTTEPLPLDLAGHDRVQGAAVDLGAYEAGASPDIASAFEVTTPEALATYALGDAFAVFWTSLDETITADDPVQITVECPGQDPVVRYAETPNDGRQAVSLPDAVGVHADPDDEAAGCSVVVALAGDPTRRGASVPFAVLEASDHVAVTTAALEAATNARPAQYGPGSEVVWKWDAAGLPAGDRARLSVVCDGREAWVPNASARNDGGYRSTVPEAFGAYATCRAEVRSAATAGVFGRSDPFSLVEDALPALEVTAPAAGATVAAGSELTVAWEATATPSEANVRVFIDDLSTSPVTVTRAAVATVGAGAVTWSVPSDLPPGGAYRVRVAVRAEDGTRLKAVVSPVTVTAPALAGPSSSVEAAPDELTVEAPRPNPSGASARVRVGVPASGPVEVAVYDVRGRRVLAAMSGERAAGWFEVPVASSDLASGVYVVRVTAGAEVATRTLTVVR